MRVSKVAIAVSLLLCRNDTDSYLYEPYWSGNLDYFIYPLADVYEIS